MRWYIVLFVRATEMAHGLVPFFRSESVYGFHDISIEQRKPRTDNRADLPLMFLPEARRSWYNSSAISKPATSPKRTNMSRYFAYGKALSFRTSTPPVVCLTSQKNGRSSTSSFHPTRSTSRYAGALSLKISLTLVKLSLNASRPTPMARTCETMQNAGSPSRRKVNFFLQHSKRQ